MAVSLSQIRVEASLDASKYLEGARAKVASDEAMVDSGDKVAGQLDITERRLGTSGSALERFVQRNDAAYRATAQYERGLAQLNRALQAGSVSQETYGRQVQLLEGNYNTNLAAAQKQEQQLKSAGAAFGGVANQSVALGGAVGSLTERFAQNRGALMSLQASGINAFQALSSGMSVWRVAQTESTQALGAFVQAGIISFRTILGWGGVIGGLAGGVLVLGSRFATITGNMRSFQLELDTFARGSTVTARDLQGMTERLRDVGTTAGEAKEIIDSALRAAGPTLNLTGQVDRISKLGLDISAVTGAKPAEEVAKLVAAMRGGVPTLADYAANLRIISAEEANAYVQRAKATGGAREYQEIMQRIAQDMEGKYTQSLSGFSKAWIGFINVWNGGIDAIVYGAERTAIAVRQFEGFGPLLTQAVKDFPAFVERVKTTAKEAGSGLAEGFSSGIAQVQKNLAAVFSGASAESAFTSLKEEGAKAADSLVESFKNGLDRVRANITAAVGETKTAIEAQKELLDSLQKERGTTPQELNDMQNQRWGRQTPAAPVPVVPQSYQAPSTNDSGVGQQILNFLQKFSPISSAQAAEAQPAVYQQNTTATNDNTREVQDLTKQVSWLPGALTESIATQLPKTFDWLIGRMTQSSAPLIAGAAQAYNASPEQLRPGSSEADAAARQVWNKWFGWTGVQDNPQVSAGQIAGAFREMMIGAGDKQADPQLTGALKELQTAAESLVAPINRLRDIIEGMPQALGTALATALPSARQLQSGGDPVIRQGGGADGGDVLAKIAQYESSNQNILQKLVPFSQSDASGFFQILSKTWNTQIAPGTGLPTVERGGVMNLPYETQRQGAQYLLNTQGITPWAGNAALMAALGGGGGSGYRLASQQTPAAANTNIYGGLDPKLIVGPLPSAGAGLPDINTIGTPKTGYGNNYIFPGGRVPAGAGTVSGAAPASTATAGAFPAPTPSQPQLNAIDEYNKRMEIATQNTKLQAAEQERARAFQEAWTRTAQTLTGEIDDQTRSTKLWDAGWKAWNDTAKLQETQSQRNTQEIQRQSGAQAQITDLLHTNSVEAIRAAEAEKALVQQQREGGDAAKIQAANLEARSAAANQALAQQLQGTDRQLTADEKLVEAAKSGVAAVKEQQITNEANARSQTAVEAAEASRNETLKAQADRLRELTAEELKRRAAAQESVQLGLRTEQTREDIDTLKLTTGLQGQTAEEIARQVNNLRLAQDLKTKFANADPEIVASAKAATEEYGQWVIKLAEARAVQERFNEEIRSIAETINSTLVSAFDDLLSGKKITDWGDRLKGMLRSISSTVVQTELIKPLLGSLFSGTSPQLAQQYGTLGGGGGLLGSVASGLGGIGKLFGLGGSESSSNGFFSGISSLFGGGSSVALTPAAAGTQFFLPGTSTAIGAVGGETLGLTAAEGATSALGSIGGVLGTIGGVLGPLAAVGGLIGGLFGNKKPSNNAGGLVLDLSNAQISDVQGGANAGVAKQIGDSLATFEKALLKQIPGATLPSGQVNVVKGDLTGITTEYSGPLGNIKASFASAQDAVTNFSVAIAQNLGNVSDTVKQVLSTITDPSQIDAALAFAKAYDNVNTAYDNIFSNVAADTVRRIGPFETALNQINDQFDTLTKSAQQYRLPLDPINQGYQAAKDRLASDFNETIKRSMEQLQNPAQAVVDEEKRAGEQRVQDAKAVGADLVAVETYNTALLKKATDDQAKSIADEAKAIADFTASIKTSFDAALSGIVDRAGPFETAANSINDNLKKLTDQATEAGRATGDIASSASGAQGQLTLYFNQNIHDLMQAVIDPVQTAIDIENQAGQRRVREAMAVSGDLDAVAKYNSANLEKVTAAAKGAVENLASAQEIAASAAGVLAASIANLTGAGKGPYAQALDTLTQQVKALTDAAQKADPLANLAVLINAFGASLVDLRGAFDANIQNLTTALTDPFQAALNTELEAGRRRVADAQAIGADLAAVDEYNRQNLLAVAKAAASASDAIATAAGFNRDIAQQILAIRDPLAASLQAELDAGEKRIAAAQQIGADLAQVDELNRLKILQLAAATDDGTAALDKFTSRMQSLQSAISQLTAGTLSGLTPAQQVSSSSANFDRLLAQVQGGNKDLIPDLTAAGTQAVQASQSVYGNAKQTADLRARVTKALQDVAADTGREASLTAQGITITATNQEQIKTALQAQAAAARSIADNAKAQADAEFKRTGVENQSLRDQANASNAIASQLEAQVKAVSTQTSVQNLITATLQESLGKQAAAARVIADQLQAQADIEFQRTGLRNNIYQKEADGARLIAYFLDIQTNAQSLSATLLNAQAAQQQAQADTEAARTGVVQNVYQQEADFSRVLGYLLSLQQSAQSLSVDQLNQQAAQLQQQANIEASKTGVVYNIYQQQANAASGLAAYLVQAGYQQTSQVDALKLAAYQARSIADTLQAQADQDYQRTGVKNTLLQDEANAARQIAAGLDKQATSQGQLSQTDASRVQVAVALLQQDAAVAARTAQQNQGAVPVSVANVGTPEQQAAYLAAAQQQASAVAGRVAAEQANAAQSAAAQSAYEAQQQQQQQQDQAHYQRLLQQQAAAQRLQQFIGGDREVGVMLAQLVRIGTIIQDYYSLPYLSRDWLAQQAMPFIQSWASSVPFALSDMLAAQGFAAGTGSAPSGWAVVGERGPELMRMRGGETILPHGVVPPRPANDDVVAELRRLQEMIAGLIRQTQGGQQIANRDAKMIAGETSAIGRKLTLAPPTRRIVA